MTRALEAYRYAHEADFVRLDALIEHGGVYSDIDTIFVNPIPDQLFAHRFVLGREANVQCPRTGVERESLCNALIMSEPGSEFARKWRSEMESAFDGSWSRHSTLLPCELAQAQPSLIHIEPPETFYGYMWTREDLCALLERCETPASGICSIHLWAHLWWSRTRTDFSVVHGDMITEDHIHNVDTTYNRLARPFLPPLSRSRSPLLRLRHLLSRIRGVIQNSLRRARRSRPHPPAEPS